jgi:hypothetical protein
MTVESAPMTRRVGAHGTPSRRPWRRRTGIAALVLALLGGGGLLFVHHQLLGDVTRLDGVFTGLDDRPERTAAGAAGLTIMMLGVRRDADADATSGEPVAWLPGARLESVTVVHLAGDRRSAASVSVPLDTLDGALSEGDATDAVGALESATDVRVDHVAVVDWASLETMAADNHAPALALAALGESDAARIDRQAAFLRALAEDTLHAEMRKQPWAIFRMADTLTDGLALDDEWSSFSMARLAFSMRDLRSADIAFLVGTPADEDLWTAVRDDQVRSWVAQHPDQTIEVAS